jgi:hypothetical protein
MRAVALDCAGDGTCRSSRGQTTPFVRAAIGWVRFVSVWVAPGLGSEIMLGVSPYYR